MLEVTEKTERTYTLTLTEEQALALASILDVSHMSEGVDRDREDFQRADDLTSEIFEALSDEMQARSIDIPEVGVVEE